MNQDELFSSVATHKLYTSVKAYSHRDGVNVIIGTQTFRFGRPSHGVRVDDHVRDVVTDAVREYTSARLRGQYDPAKGWEILRSGPKIHRGEHAFSVWVPNES